MRKLQTQTQIDATAMAWTGVAIAGMLAYSVLIHEASVTAAGIGVTIISIALAFGAGLTIRLMDRVAARIMAAAPAAAGFVASPFMWAAEPQSLEWLQWGPGLGLAAAMVTRMVYVTMTIEETEAE